MPLNGSGQISIGGSTAGQSINLELGSAATATRSLNDSTSRTLAGVASGAISLSNFWGKSNSGLDLPFLGSSPFSLTRNSVGATATASINFQVTGTIGRTSDNALPKTSWFLPVGGTPGNSYWIQRVIVSGTLSTDSGAGWLQLSTTRTFSRNRTTVGTTSTVLYFQIATDAGGTNIVATSPNCTLTATYESGG